MGSKRVVVTGMGAITPIGNNLNDYKNSLYKGSSGCDNIKSFDITNFKTKFACEVKGYDPLDYFDRKESRKMDKYAQFGMIAAAEAISDSNLDIDKLNLARIGVIWGSGVGGIETFHGSHQLIIKKSSTHSNINFCKIIKFYNIFLLGKDSVGILSFFSPEMTYIKDEPENILSEKMDFKVKNINGDFEKFENSLFNISKDNRASVNWISENESKNFNLVISGMLEYDGMMDYKIQLIAKNDVNLNDVSLKISFKKEAAKYMLGLGNKGGELNNNINWQWDINKHQEGLWLGNINKGLQYVLRDNNYERPLNTNFYRSKPLNLPTSWYNNSKGGISLKINKEVVDVNNYSGKRSVKIGDTLNFNVRFLITPFKTIDIKEHFDTRFVHKYIPVDSVLDLNGTVVNVRHANEINPYINYPFYNINKQKEYIDEAHSKGIKVKLYNTIRELTYKTYEMFALRSLGTEIFNDGNGGGHSWLQEHLKSNYHSAWHAVRVNDASILNKGTSRWTNYYIEGINWLAKNNSIDGLYLDDIAFSRSTVKRIANVFSMNRDSFVIDLHSANQFNIRDGYINSAFLYMEHFPFVSRLWFGEYFEYELEPDYWMTEVSGIPFGLTGEMLEKGGRPYHGLVYGMTTRVYHKYNPGNIWKIFDDFGISDSRMIGYWVDYSPIKVDNTKVKCTIYKRDDKVLISLASWSKKDEDINLLIDWEDIKLNPLYSELISPKIDDLQDYKKYKIGEKIKIEANGGLVLVISKN